MRKKNSRLQLLLEKLLQNPQLQTVTGMTMVIYILVNLNYIQILIHYQHARLGQVYIYNIDRFL